MYVYPRLDFVCMLSLRSCVFQLPPTIQRHAGYAERLIGHSKLPESVNVSVFGRLSHSPVTN